ncbi:MAG: hypothetical protein ABIG40_02455 [Parcubacteria group bacterium]
MLRVYKYTIPVKDYFTFELPAGVQILTVQAQHDEPQIWALVDPKEQDTVHFNFRIAGTGHDIKETKDDLEYIGTFQLAGGSFIGHLFRIIGR